MIQNEEKEQEMGKIYYLMGKSASGKDTVYKRLLTECPQLKTVVLYTTRPMRDGEQDGVEYYFTTAGQLEDFEKQGKLIEVRTYQTIFGPWSYGTVDDGQIDLAGNDYLVMGTLESYDKMRDYFGAEAVIPVYIRVDDGLRLIRAVNRERQQTEPKYKELCRRFLADEEDFSAEKLKNSRIERWFDNEDLDTCLQEVLRIIQTGN